MYLTRQKMAKGPPKWIPPTVWAELLRQWQEDESYKLQSVVGIANRASDVGGLGPSVHYGGSSSFLGTKRKMEKKLNKKVGVAEVYLETHKKGDRFSCPHAQKAYKTFEEL